VTQALEYDPYYVNYPYLDGSFKKRQKEGPRTYWEGTKGKIPGDPFNPHAIELAPAM
jgi:hypothetical protein